jgi:hypothetical protein
MPESLSRDRSIQKPWKHQEALMNYSIYSADRPTHLKIVIVALVAGIASFGIAAHLRAGDQYSRAAHVVEAGNASMRFADALPVRQDTLSDLIFVNGSSALSDTQTK